MKYVLFPLGFFSLNISHLWPTAGEWDAYNAVVNQHVLSEVYVVALCRSVESPANLELVLADQANHEVVFAGIGSASGCGSTRLAAAYAVSDDDNTTWVDVTDRL